MFNVVFVAKHSFEKPLIFHQLSQIHSNSDKIIVIDNTEFLEKYYNEEYIIIKDVEANKTDFLVLDLGGNFESHGALGSPYTEPSKKEIKQKKGKICPSCEEYVMPPSLMECPDCGYIFTPAEARQISHESNPDFDSDAIYDGDSDIEKFRVIETQYKIHRSLKGSMSLKVEYLISGHKYPISEWLSPYGSRSAYVKQWFLERGHDIYGDINQYSLDDLLFFTNKLISPTHIQAKRNGKYYNITGYYFE